jgi:hypothetical protein
LCEIASPPALCSTSRSKDAFEGLGATDARSATFEDNPRSEAIARSLDYQSNGSARVALDGMQPCRELLDSTYAAAGG